MKILEQKKTHAADVEREWIKIQLPLIEIHWMILRSPGPGKPVWQATHVQWRFAREND